MPLLSSLMTPFSHLAKKYSARIRKSLLPWQCLFCSNHSAEKNICSACQESLPILTHHCRQCAQILPQTYSELLCGLCLKDPPLFQRTYALFSYQPPITQLITGLKFGGHLSYGLALGELLAEKVKYEWYAHSARPDLIIPVPLHAKRLQQRGFNQALEIALPLAREITIDKQGVKRVKNTRAQSQLNAEARIQNIAHAFQLNRNYTGAYIAILDDVMTTGATLRELSATLYEGGASKIDVWCCARRSESAHL